MRMPAAVFAFLLLPFQALAWDQSLLAEARFSPDGRYFAFVEYVEFEADEGGSAAMYVVDTTRDTWVPGTPIKVELSGEGANGAKALAEVKAKGRSLIDRFGLTQIASPALPFATVYRGDPYRRRMEAEVPQLGGRLRLEEREAKAAHDCTEDRPTGVDFQLLLSGPRAMTLTNFTDALPRSRGCPDGYDVAAAFVHEGADKTVLAVLVGVFTRGWEGSDRNLIALTKVLP